MSGIEGIQMGLPKHPRIRTGMPREFSRPRIDLDGAKAVRRDWKQIPAGLIAEGDNVPGVGVVREVEELAAAHFAGTVYRTVLLRGGEGNTKAFNADEPVFCFTAARGD